ncbi:MAG: molybdopterin-dependent oxidoreductase [Actinobacteria bacterium]|nr:molybdopterin-dependent oxidoreductase [Actinomycetota bacterium]
MNEQSTVGKLLEAQATKTVKAVCGICNGACGLNVSIEDGTVVEVQGWKGYPYTEGFICPKGKAIPEIINAPDRIRRPLYKLNDGSFVEISWDEALDMIADSLNRIKAEHGAEVVAIHTGQAGVRKEFPYYAQRFCQAFGTPNYSSAGSHCHMSKLIAGVLTFGGLPVPDFENTDLVALWGYNPQISCPPQYAVINKSLNRGAKLIVVDPRIIPLARKADVHLQLRPGTDGALALGLLNVIITENLYDKKFVEKWTVGFDELASLVGNYPPDVVERITWVPADKIRESACLCAGSPSMAGYPGIALELQTNGVQSIRSIAILQAITGNLDIPGGSLFLDHPKLESLKLPGNNGQTKQAIGKTRFPLFTRVTGNAQANVYADAVLEEQPYKLRAMILDGVHPIATWPNAGKVKKALASLDFLVVVDQFLTETAELADVVLPAAHFLNRYEFWEHASMYGVPRIGLAIKAFEDKDGRLSDLEFWLALAEKMGLDEHFPWKDEEEAFNHRLAPLGLTLDELRNYENGYTYTEHKEKQYERTRFKTPSGKVELYSEELEKHGYNPLPVYEEPAESPVSMPEIAAEHPFILTTGKRTPGYHHSRYRNIPSLRKRQPDSLVEVHPDTAACLGLCDGDTVVVESPRGSDDFKVSITEEVDPRVIYAPHGWEEGNANILTDNQYLDSISGFPGDRALLARIRGKP